MADEEEWPALPEIKYEPISPSLLTSISSSFLSSLSYFLWSYFLTSFFSSYILGDDGDELHGDSANNMSQYVRSLSRRQYVRPYEKKNPDSVVLNLSCHKL